MSDTSKPLSKVERLAQMTAVIFDEDIGKRLKLIRMKRLLDQAQLGLLLGVSQSVVSDIELGRFKVTERITVAWFQYIFGEDATFILYGSGESKYDPSLIGSRYWRAKLKTCGSQKNRGKNQ